MSESDSSSGGGPEPTPVGDGEYVVEQGECISSIAFENGFKWETLWNDPGNAALKSARKDPNVLLPGDKVHIPEVRVRTESCATDSKHQFVRAAATEVFRVVLLDKDGKPRKSLPYSLRIEGQPPKAGKTDGSGAIEETIAPNAREGELFVFEDDLVEHYALQLGGIDPPNAISGVQARLNNLGFSCGEVDGQMGPLTAAAIGKFQASQNLTVTGDLDESTRNALVSKHGY